MLQLPPLQAGVPLLLLQAEPQPPQLALSVAMCVSQPAADVQSPQPGEQVLTWQLPVLQSPAAFGGLQPWPQAPQLVLVFSWVSQPSVGSPLQSPQPAAQVGLQAPAEQVVDPCPLAHFTPHAPQFDTVLSGVSQPVEILPSQLSNPALQVMAHRPWLHDGVPFVLLQTFPQPPQLPTSDFRLASQPSVYWLLQFAKFVLQPVIPHLPALQATVALAAEQALPHFPQLPGSVEMLASQPLLASPSQSARLPVHWLTPHTPPTQLGVPVPDGQPLPHAEQLSTFVLMFVSQPSTGSKLQSSNPVAQLTPHTPLVQLGVEWLVLQALPQAPQLLTSLSSWASQPSVGSALQSV